MMVAQSSSFSRAASLEANRTAHWSINMTGATLVLQLFLLTVFINFTHATNVEQCQSAKQNLERKVNITSCHNPPCKLKKRTSPTVRIAFRPDHEIKDLRTSVNAALGGIRLPFVGVDGTSACGKIFKPDGKTSVNCPLKKHTNYLYINSLKVLPQYPTVKVSIRWALVDQHTNKAVLCFEVPAQITN